MERNRQWLGWFAIGLGLVSLFFVMQTRFETRQSRWEHHAMQHNAEPLYLQPTVPPVDPRSERGNGPPAWAGPPSERVNPEFRPGNGPPAWAGTPSERPGMDIREFRHSHKTGFHTMMGLFGMIVLISQIAGVALVVWLIASFARRARNTPTPPEATPPPSA